MLLEGARQAYGQRKFEAAVTQFEQAHNACGRPASTLLPLAQARLMAQNLDGSLTALDELIRLEPANTDALKLRGDVLYLLAREPEAERSFRRALEISPSHTGALYALGRIRYQQNRFPDAVKIFSELVQKDPLHYRAHDNLALSYAALQEDAKALQHFLKALDIVHKSHPEYDTVYANAANFFLDRGQFQKAFQLGAEAAKRNPGYARNFFLTGKALVKLEKHELSLRWLKQAAELDPTYKEPHYWLGTVYRKLGQTEESARSLQRFRELSTAPAAKR